MVSKEDLIKLSKMAQDCLGLPEEELIEFVKNGAVRAYKASSSNAEKENVSADFHPQSDALRLLCRKVVVAKVTDASAQCSQIEGGAAIGQLVDIEILDSNTKAAIEAAYNALKSHISAEWKKQNAEIGKVKYSEIKEQCLQAKILSKELSKLTISVGSTEAYLPTSEQLNEDYTEGKEIVVYVKDLSENDGVFDIIASRRDKALVKYALKRHVPEIDAGNVETKSVARVAGKRSLAAVYSEDFAPVERCKKKSQAVSDELGGEEIDFVEWYQDKKAFIVSALQVEARRVTLTEKDKQALVEAFKESEAKLANGLAVKLASELTGYNIEIKLVNKDSDVPGV